MLRASSASLDMSIYAMTSLSRHSGIHSLLPLNVLFFAVNILVDRHLENTACGVVGLNQGSLPGNTCIWFSLLWVIIYMGGFGILALFRTPEMGLLCLKD